MNISLHAGTTLEPSYSGHLLGGPGSTPPSRDEAWSASPDPLFVIDRQHRAWPMNQAARSLLPDPERRDAPFCHRLFHDLDQPCSSPEIPCPLRRVFETGLSVRVEHSHDGGGHRSIFEIAAAPFLNRGHLDGIVASLRDVSHRKQVETALLDREAHYRHLATHDSLTGLLNRASFLEQLEHAVSLARRAGRRLAVAFLDLDDFKSVNDQHGHLIGDRLLEEFSRRLLLGLRESDVLARLGGDEFAFILEDVVDGPAARKVADKLLGSLAGDYQLEGWQDRVDVSIGISLFPGHGVYTQQLMRQADRAMYRAKQTKGSRVELA